MRKILKYATSPFSKYFDLSGRSNRLEFWYFTIMCVGIQILFKNISDVISVIFTFIILIPIFSLSVRRLHDQGRSLFFLIWSIIPTIIGLLLTIINIYRSLISAGLQDNVDIEAISGPVGGALKATAVGLIVSIVIYYITMSIRGSKGENKYGMPDKVDKLFD